MSNSTEATEATEKKGRRLDGTPNKVFGEKVIERHEDGTVTYQKTFNDENGVRQVVTERREAKKRGGGGRGIDATPNREFSAIKKCDNDDGTVTYIIPYNDKNGVRKEREEIRQPKARGGHRKPDSTPLKVVSNIKSERIANEEGTADSNNLVVTASYNNQDGERLESFVVLSVNSKGSLSAKVVEEKPEVYIRQRKTASIGEESEASSE